MRSVLRYWFVISLVIVSFGATACGSAKPTSSTPPASETTPQPVQTPIVIESTRIVEKQVVVTATPSPTVACHPETAANSSEVVIGALVPLSGRSAAGGLTLQAGINIAVDKINSEGGIQGKQLKLVSYDTASNPTIGISRTVQLITQDCAIGIVGVYDSDVGMEVKDVLGAYHIPGIFVDTYNDQITASLLPEVFRIAPSTTMFAQMSASWLSELGDFNGDGKLFAVIVVEDAPYGKMQVEQTIPWLNAAHIEHNELFVDLPTSDFSPVIARIVDMDTTPDAILLRIMGDSNLVLEQQLLKNGIGPRKNTVIVAGQTALNDLKFWQMMGSEGVSTVALRIGPWQSTVSAEGQEFADKYRQYIDQWPTNAAFGGYDAVRLLVDAAQRSPTFQGSDLIRALEETEIILASGDYSFPINQKNPPTNDTPAYLWHQWQNVPLLYLQYTEPLQPSSAMAVIWPPIYRTIDGPIVPPSQ